MEQDTVWLDGSGAATIVRESSLPWVSSQGDPRGTVTGNRIAGGVELAGALELDGRTIGADGKPGRGAGRVQQPARHRQPHHRQGGRDRGHRRRRRDHRGQHHQPQRHRHLVQPPAAATLSIAGNVSSGIGTDLDAPPGSGITLGGNEVCDPAASGAP